MVVFPLGPYANFLISGEWHQLYTLHFCVPLSAWKVEKCILGYVVPNSQASCIERHSQTPPPTKPPLYAHTQSVATPETTWEKWFRYANSWEEKLCLCLKIKQTTAAALQIPNMKYQNCNILVIVVTKQTQSLFSINFLNVLL